MSLTTNLHTISAQKWDFFQKSENNGRDNNACDANPLNPITKFFALTNDQLLAELQRRNVKGMTIRNGLDLLPDSILSRTQNAIARVIGNFINPQGRCACFARRSVIAADSRASVATVDRFTSSAVGKALFECHRPEDTHRYDASIRTMTRGLMLFLLAVDEFKSNISKSLKQLKAFALKAAPALLFGSNQGTQGDSSQGAHGEGQRKGVVRERTKEKDIAGGQRRTAFWQKWFKRNEISAQNLEAERQYHQRQEEAQRNQRFKHATKPAQRDINAISQPESTIPDGFRGAGEPDPVIINPEPRHQVPELSQIERDLYQHHRSSGTLRTMNPYILNRCRAAGLETV